MIFTHTHKDDTFKWTYSCYLLLCVLIENRKNYIFNNFNQYSLQTHINSLTKVYINT